MVNWNDRNVNIINISVEESYPPSLPPTLLPSLKDELEAKIEKIRNGAKQDIGKLKEQIVKNKAESDKTIKDLRHKIDLVYELTTLTPKDQKQRLGDEIFPMIQKVNSDLVVKVTGMLLEQDNMKIIGMLDDENYFNNKVKKALDSLKTK